MRKLIAVIAALLVFVATSAESCEEKKRNAQRNGGLPRVIVVSVTASATVAGFHWELKVQGGNFRKRTGTERTLDMPAQRIEVVDGKDIRVEFRAWSKNGSVKQCKMTVKLGLQKASQTSAPEVHCNQNVSALFDDKEYT